MKFRTTQKAIRNGFNKVICVPYCALYNLVEYDDPVAYTVRNVGFGADIYDMGDGVAIATGYAPFGNVKPDYDTMRDYNERAGTITHDYKLSWDERRERIRTLQKDFITNVAGKKWD